MTGRRDVIKAGLATLAATQALPRLVGREVEGKKGQAEAAAVGSADDEGRAFDGRAARGHRRRD